MKKISLVAAVLLMSNFVFAQTPKLGIRAGVNTAKFGGDGNNSQTYVGINAGADLAIPVSRNFSFQPEVAYSELGAKGTQGGVEVKNKLSYLTIPVLAKYTFPTSGFSIYAGPQVGYILSARAKSSLGTVDIKDGFQSTDFSGVFGFEFMFPQTPLYLSARYQLGFTDIDKSNNVKLNNNSGTFLLGFRL